MDSWLRPNAVIVDKGQKTAKLPCEQDPEDAKDADDKGSAKSRKRKRKDDKEEEEEEEEEKVHKATCWHIHASRPDSR